MHHLMLLQNKDLYKAMVSLAKKNADYWLWNYEYIFPN